MINLFISDSLIQTLIFVIWTLLAVTVASAVYCLRLRFVNNHHEIKQKKLFDHWEKSFFDYLYGNMDADQWMARISSKQFRYFLEYIKSYLITLRGEDLNKLSALMRHPRLYDYLNRRLKRGGHQARSEAAFYFGLARIEKSKSGLVTGLKDRDHVVCYNCAMSLGKLGAVEAIDDIFIQYSRRRQFTRNQLMRILFEFGSNVCPSLLEQLPKAKHDSARLLIVSLFEYFKFYPAGPQLIDLLQKTKNVDLQLSCISALGAIEYIDALPILKSFLNHPTIRVRRFAIDAIGKIGDLDLKPDLYHLMKHENWWLRYSAAEALWKITNHDVRVMENIYQHSDNQYAVSTAQVLLAEKQMGA